MKVFLKKELDGKRCGKHSFREGPEFDDKRRKTQFAREEADFDGGSVVLINPHFDELKRSSTFVVFVRSFVDERDPCGAARSGTTHTTRLSFPAHLTFRFAISPLQALRDNDLLLAHFAHLPQSCAQLPFAEVAPRLQGLKPFAAVPHLELKSLGLWSFEFDWMAGGLRLFLTVPPTTAYTRINGVEKVQKVHKRVHGLYNIRAATAPGQGGGVLDRPTLDKPTPGRESEFDLKRKKKTSPPYRVMLHNDNFNKREYVVQVLMKAIPGMTVDIAVNVMNEAHINGLAVVIVCPQEDAEDYCMQLRTNGLLSSIEPDSC